MKKLDFTASRNGRKNNLVGNQRPERVALDFLYKDIFSPVNADFNSFMEVGICRK